MTGAVPDGWSGLTLLAASGTGLQASAAAGGSYPSYFKLDAAQRSSNAEGHFSCPAPVGKDGQQFTLPLGYDGYTHCTCDSGYSGANGTCSICPAGSWSDSASVAAGVTNERPAPALLCSACAAGSWSSAGQSVCTQCPSGTAGYAATATACESCRAGSFASAPGLSSCSACAAGTWSTAGLSACLACRAPSVVATNRSSCDPPPLCGAGQEHSADKGACVPCLPGYSRSADSADWQCKACVGNSHATRYGMLVSAVC